LYALRRRCVKYTRYIGEAKKQCCNKGQRHWHSSINNINASNNHVDKDQNDPQAEGSKDNILASDLKDDFADIQERFLETQTRTDKNISLLTALISIGEGEESHEESRGIQRLTILNTIFLPLSTVAQIITMEKSSASTLVKFKLYWGLYAFFILLISFVFWGWKFVRSRQAQWKLAAKRKLQKYQISHEESGYELKDKASNGAKNNVIASTGENKSISDS